MLEPDQILVIYDGGCGFCSQVVDSMRRSDWREAMVFLPSQTPGLLEAAGLSEEDAAQTVLVLSPGGRTWKEFGAVAAVLDELFPVGLPILRGISLVPGLRHLGNAGYRLVARNRGRFGSTPPDLSLAGPPTLDAATLQEIERRRLADRMPTALPPRMVD